MVAGASDHLAFSLVELIVGSHTLLAATVRLVDQASRHTGLASTIGVDSISGLALSTSILSHLFAVSNGLSLDLRNTATSRENISTLTGFA